MGSLFAQSIPVRLIDSLEVLTGGLGAEYGNRLAAVVNINTRRGGNTLDGMVQLRYGSFETWSRAVFVPWPRPVFVLCRRQLHAVAAHARPAGSGDFSAQLWSNARLFARLDYTAGEHDRIELFANYAQNRFQIPINQNLTPTMPACPTVGGHLMSMATIRLPYVPTTPAPARPSHEVF